MSAPSANDLYHAAQKFIKSGQPVFPCHSAGARAKAPMTKHGVLDATLNITQVKRWWKSHGSAAIGIPTGIVWDVLDVDTKGSHDGRTHLRFLQGVGLLNGCKRAVRTPSGGLHLYFRTAPGLTNKASAALGLDVRSKGGYVLAYPSYIETEEYAGAYEVVGDTTESTDEPLLWDLIHAALAPKNTITNKPVELLSTHRASSLPALRNWLANREKGERNNSLHWAVCRCIDNGIDPNELVEVATMIGLDEDEVTLTIGSALRRAGVTADDLSTEAEALFGD